MSRLVARHRAHAERAPDLIGDLLRSLLECSDALKVGNAARLAAAESRRRHVLRLLVSPAIGRAAD